MRIQRTRNVGLVFSTIALVLLATGCCTPRQDEAASVHFAVLSVAPWEDYREALQPNFKLTAEDAVAQAVPTTLALEEKFLNAFSARLKVAAPGTSFTDTSTVHLENGTVTTNKEDITKSASSGDASKVSLADSPTGSRTAASLPPSSSVLGTALSVDPMLKYLAATALYQEVQLLNRYVKNAAIDGRYAAYAVRLQVSLMPRMRDEPYDAYSTISFFSGPFDPGTGGGAPFKAPDEPAVSSSAQPGPGTEDDSAKRIKIIPLLVTDDIEAAIHSRSADQLRQLALALSAVVQGAGVGADIQSVDEKLRTVLGRDFNSTFTVARVSDNTLRCRFGALNQAQSRYSMVPQTHNVTLLVLIPHGDAASGEATNRTVRLVARTTLTDVESGKDLRGRTGAEALEAVNGILRGHGITQPLLGGEASEILYAVADNDYTAFNKLVTGIVNRKPAAESPAAACCQQQERPKKPAYPESIWVDVVSIRNRSPFASARFTVPQKHEPSLRNSPTAPPTPILMDDGKTASVVRLRGGLGLDSDKMAATLTISEGVTLAHTDLKVSNGGKEIELNFPSLAAYKLNHEGKLETKDIKLTLYELDKGTALTTANCLYLIAAEPAKPQFSMTTRASVVQADKDSKGKLSVIFAGKSDKPGIFFTVKGADAEIEQTPGGPVVAQKDEGWNVGGFGVVHLNLSNLDPISPITVSAKDTTNNLSLSPIVLSVIKPAGTKQ